jgi:hypothetical protein
MRLPICLLVDAHRPTFEPDNQAALTFDVSTTGYTTNGSGIFKRRVIGLVPQSGNCSQRLRILPGIVRALR